MLAVALTAPFSTARAHVISDREVKIFQKFNASDVAAVLADARPDSAGAVKPDDSSRGWSARPQADAMLLLMTAASRADSAAAERAWKAVDFTFGRQRPDGGFDFGRSGTDAGFEPAIDAGPVSLIGELGRAEIALENGPLQARFHWRVVLMLPKLRRSLDSMVVAVPTLLARSAKDPGALMSAAECCLVGDGIFHVEAIGLAGQKLLVAALALQQRDGAFGSGGPGALAAHALALEKLQPLVQYFPAPSLEDAEKRAASWLLKRMESATKPADWIAPGASVAPGAANAGATLAARRAQARALFALMHWAARSDDANLRKRVDRVVTRWRAANGR